MDERLRGWLRVSWWAIGPAFLLLVGSFIVERACFDRYALLPRIGTRPRLAWLLASVYVLSHVWLLAAYAATAMRTGELWLSLRVAREAWGREWFKVVAMLGVFALEYVPAAVWDRLAHLLGVCPA